MFEERDQFRFISTNESYQQMKQNMLPPWSLSSNPWLPQKQYAPAVTCVDDNITQEARKLPRHLHIFIAICHCQMPR